MGRGGLLGHATGGGGGGGGVVVWVPRRRGLEQTGYKYTADPEDHTLSLFGTDGSTLRACLDTWAP